MARFDDSDGETPCWSCGKVTPKGELVALVQTSVSSEDEASYVELQTCVDLRCEMKASKAKVVALGG